MLRVTCDGERLTPATVVIREPPGGVPSAVVAAVGAAARCLLRGRELFISARGLEAPLFVGRIASRTVRDSATGESVVVEARGAANVLEDRVSAVVEDGSRRDVIVALLTPSTIAAPDSPGGDQRDAFVALDEPTLPLIARLELLAGRIALYLGDGTLASADPANPAVPVAVPRCERTVLEMTESDRHPLRLSAPDPACWGETLHHDEGGEAGLPTIEILLPEAVSVAELGAAGKALAAVAAAGSFHLEGGATLLSVRPGSWIDTPGLGSRLVTGRSLAWSSAGLSVTLQGGFPWGDVAFRPARPSEPASVVSVDAKAGRALVTLALSGITVPVGVVTATSSSSATVVAGPRPGDRGLVAFAFGSAHHGVYLGAPLVPGAVDQKTLDTALLALVRGGDRAEFGEGITFDWKGPWNARLDEYDFH